LSFWCDDSLLRQRARGRRVDSFSTLESFRSSTRQALSIPAVLISPWRSSGRWTYLSMRPTSLPWQLILTGTRVPHMLNCLGAAGGVQAQICVHFGSVMESEAWHGGDALDWRATSVRAPLDFWEHRRRPYSAGTQRLSGSRCACSRAQTRTLPPLYQRLPRQSGQAQRGRPLDSSAAPFVLHALSEFFATKGAPEPLSLA